MKKELTLEMQNLIKANLIQQITDADINKFLTLKSEDTIRLEIVVKQDLSITDLEAYINLNNGQ